MKRVGFPLLLSLWLGPGALAQTDRGQPVNPDQAMALRPDVAQTVGLPRGRPVSGAALERRTEALSSRMRCPVCQGAAINDSPAEAARNMKRQVRAMIAAGYDDDQIFRYFETSYGEFIRLMPRAEGLNLLVWLMPMAALAIGLAIVAMMVRRRETGSRERGPDRSERQVGAATTAETTEGAEGAEDLEPWVARVREEVAKKDE